MASLATDAALAVIDVQEDFCPPVCQQNSIFGGLTDQK